MAKRHKTHVFSARTYTEAINKATAKLGKDISIVNRRDVKMENLFSKLTSGKLGGDTHEVVLEVAVNEPGPSAPEKASNPLLEKTYAKAIELAAGRAIPPAAISKPSLGEAATGIAGRLDELKQALEAVNREHRQVMERAERENRETREEFRRLLALQARGGMPRVNPELYEHYQRLVEADISEELARELVEGIDARGDGLAGESAALREELARAVARRIPSAGPILLKEGAPTVVALIGPTGVGKSSTVAKLAVDFSVRLGKSVGLVNEDRTRPGADSQLRNLGQLMSIPAMTAEGAEGVRRVIKSMANLDLILLDTGGRSPRDEAGLAELRSVIAAADADETHLVVSTGSSEKTVFEIVARFRRVGFDRLIFTKLDEAMTHGALVNVASRLSDGLSYVTTGQSYTESLVPADSGVLAGLVMGGYEVSAGGVRRAAGGGDAL